MSYTLVYDSLPGVLAVVAAGDPQSPVPPKLLRRVAGVLRAAGAWSEGCAWQLRRLRQLGTRPGDAGGRRPDMRRRVRPTVPTPDAVLACCNRKRCDLCAPLAYRPYGCLDCGGDRIMPVRRPGGAYAHLWALRRRRCFVGMGAVGAEETPIPEPTHLLLHGAGDTDRGGGAGGSLLLRLTERAAREDKDHAAVIAWTTRLFSAEEVRQAGLREGALRIGVLADGVLLTSVPHDMLHPVGEGGCSLSFAWTFR